MKDSIEIVNHIYGFKAGVILQPTGRENSKRTEFECINHIPEKGYLTSPRGFQIIWLNKETYHEIYAKQKIKVLVLCEESQEVCKAFRKQGFIAFSCDLQDCSGGHPEWHIKKDALEVMESQNWDLIIAHPPCTFISRAGARWMYPTAGSINRERLEEAMQAKQFFMKILNGPAKLIAIENPTPLRVVDLPRHSQAIQPYEYGHPFSKKTLLWLKGGLPNLKPACKLENYVPYLPSNTGGAKRGQKFMYKSISQKDRSKTFSGIANAMAEQWGKYLIDTFDYMGNVTSQEKGEGNG